MPPRFLRECPYPHSVRSVRIAHPDDSAELQAKLVGETTRANAEERARDQAEADRDCWPRNGALHGLGTDRTEAETHSKLCALTTKHEGMFRVLKIIITSIAFIWIAGIVIAEPMKKCSGNIRENCLVDGDTIWINGKKFRMAGYDTPEPLTQICGGEKEVALANKATARALELINTKKWTVKYSGNIDKTGSRELITIRIENRDLGDILIEEHLARKWPDGEEFWCSE